MEQSQLGTAQYCQFVRLKSALGGAHFNAL